MAVGLQGVPDGDRRGWQRRRRPRHLLAERPGHAAGGVGSENGLGVALIAARAQANPARVWGIALVATAVAGLGYALIALVGRLSTPWAPATRAGRRAA